MAIKNQTTDALPDLADREIIKTPELFEIDELRKKHRIRRAVFAGVCAAMGWAPGRRISEEAFLSSVRQFESAPMSGSPVKKKEAR